MADNDNGRKKALIVSMLVFLFLGGGIFLFFVIQGADDLKDNKTKNFSYGSEARAGFSAFIKSIGFASDEPKLSQADQKRIAERELAPSSSELAAGISDWMDKSGSVPDTAVNRFPSGSRAFGDSVPRMAAKGSSLGSMGGAATKSSTAFGSEGDSGNVKISRASAFGAKGEGAKSGTLSSLRNTRAFLGDALRSSSAMEAKNKWGQSFGVGNAASASGLAYGESGLAKLDTIKSGEIDSLKMAGMKSLKPGEVSPPTRDKSAEANDPALNKMKEAAKNAANPTSGLANSMFSPMANKLGAEAPPSAEDRNPTPPTEVTMAAKNLASYCSAGCSCGEGCTFKDDPNPTCKKTPDGWQATVSGQQEKMGLDGNMVVTTYKDIYNVIPGGNPPTIPAAVSPK